MERAAGGIRLRYLISVDVHHLHRRADRRHLRRGLHRSLVARERVEAPLAQPPRRRLNTKDTKDTKLVGLAATSLCSWCPLCPLLLALNRDRNRAPAW